MPIDVGEFQLIDRKVWQAVVSHDDHYPYIRGIIASVGFRRVIVPYTWAARKQGVSKNNLPRLIDQALNGIFSFTNVPLRLCTLARLRASRRAASSTRWSRPGSISPDRRTPRAER